MSLEFLGIELMQDNLKDTMKLFSLGAISDLRLISTTFLPLLVAMTLSILKSFKYSNYRGGGGQNLSLNRYYAYFSSIFIAFLAFVFISFCFINFYYYELYHTKIDIFIFGLKDDNTQAILDIVFKDYPLGVLLLIALAFSAFCVWLNKKILNLNLPSVNLKFPVVLALLLIFLALYIVALRGHFSYVAMRAGNYRFSNLENFNALALNPLMSFNFALRDYKKDTLDLKPANMERLEELEKIFLFLPQVPKMILH